MNSIAANIPKLYFIKGFRWFMVIVPILVPFFKANNLSIQQIMILQALFSIAVVILEVPSGYFADIIGRKGSIIAGLGFSFVGLLTYSLLSGFWSFLLAEIVLGFGASFISGADSALIYDSLLEMSREEEYKKLEGRNQAIGNFSEGAASILAGFVAVISMRFPFYIQTFLTLPAMAIALTLIEPASHRENRRKPNILEIISVSKYALHENKQLKWLLIFSAIVGASTITMAWLTQPYFMEVGLPLPLFGVIWAALQFSVGVFSLSAHSFEKALGKPTMLVLLVILIGVGYFSLGLTKAIWGISLIIIFYFVRGMNYPLLSGYINQLTKPKSRATILSMNSLLFRLLFSIMGPVFGFIADRYTLQAALFCCSVLFTIMGMIALLFLAKSGALYPVPCGVTEKAESLSTT